MSVVWGTVRRAPLWVSGGRFAARTLRLALAALTLVGLIGAAGWLSLMLADALIWLFEA